jgi:hypothetical protein
VRLPSVLVLVAAGTVAVAAPSAAGDGLPVLAVDVGASGVAAPGGTVRYVTVTVGKTTMVEAVRRNGGQIVRMHGWPGVWTIPAVAYDRTAGGLSADRGTLVLIEPRKGFPRARTRLLVLRARTLRSADVVPLDGDFSFDAVSPDGRRIYLIQYSSPIDPTRYLVRAYDVPTRRLLPRPIVDPRDTTEKMRGNPLSRVASLDGRWAYTLYDGGGHPFIHALDTRGGTAWCIDLEGIPPRLNLWRLRLHLGSDGGLVTVDDGSRTLAAIDTSTLEPPVVHAGRRWWPVAVAAAIVAALVAAAAYTLRRRPRLGPAPVD